MNTKRNVFQRSFALASALLVMAIGLVPALSFSTVNAAQVASRSILASDSTVGATGVTYKVTFTAQTAALSLVMDFCQDSAIIGASCNVTNGVTFASPTISASTMPTGWTTVASTGSTFKLAGTTTALVPSTVYTFTINGVKNPTGTSATVGQAGSYYSRITTYANNAYGTYASAAAPGNYVDYGGFAMSTANNVNISATVMETLTFCVTKVAPTNGCANSSTSIPNLVLGSGTPVTLGSTFSTDTAYTQLSTNANAGAVVSLIATSSNFCSGLSRDSGATCGIPAQGNTAITAATANTNAAATFGLNVGAGSGGTGTVTATAPYSTASNYAMATTAYNTPSNIESSTAATSNVNSLLTYGAIAAATTPAGVYTTTEALVATGTF